MFEWMQHSFKEDLSNHLLSHFQINGAVPVTYQQVQSLVDSMSGNILRAIQNVPAVSTSLHAAGGGRQQTDETTGSTLFYWGDGFHMVPEGFSFPHSNVPVKTLWDLWWSGNAAKRIGPYRKIQGNDLISKTERTYLSKAKFVMEELVLLARQEGLATEKELRTMEPVERDKVFDKAFFRLTEKISSSEMNLDSNNQNRFGEKSYITLYRLISKSSRHASVVL